MHQENKEKIVAHINDIKVVLTEIDNLCQDMELDLGMLEEVLKKEKIVKTRRSGKGKEM